MDSTENRESDCAQKFAHIKPTHFYIVIGLGTVIFSIWIVIASYSGDIIAVIVCLVAISAFYVFAYQGCKYIICRSPKPPEEQQIQLQQPTTTSRNVIFTNYTERRPSQEYRRIINGDIDHNVMDDVHDMDNMSILDESEHGAQDNTADRNLPRVPDIRHTPPSAFPAHLVIRPTPYTRYTPPSAPSSNISTDENLSNLHPTAYNTRYTVPSAPNINPDDVSQDSWMPQPRGSRNTLPPPSYEEVMEADTSSVYADEPPPPSYDSVT